MDDLIRRQAAIELLKNWSGGYDYIETETEGAIKEFQQLPSAERKKGHWIMINDHTAKCSCCNERRWVNGHDYTMKGHIFYAMYKYCPECGAEMKGKEE